MTMLNDETIYHFANFLFNIFFLTTDEKYQNEDHT